MFRIRIPLTTKEMKCVKILALISDRTVRSYLENLINTAALVRPEYIEPVTYIRPYDRFHDIDEWAHIELNKLAHRATISLAHYMRFLVIEDIKRNPITIKGEEYCNEVSQRRAV